MKRDQHVCAVLVPSCDNYSDLWTPFFTLFFRHWPDCPFRIYLGSNSRGFADSRVTVINCGHNLSWADCVSDYLRQVPEPTVLLCLEDFFLRMPVNNDAVVRILHEFCQRDADMFRLVRRPGPTSLLPQYDFGPIDIGAPYRVSTQVAFWRKETLMDLIKSGESIWQFEHAGSLRSGIHPIGFYAVERDIVPYKHHVVERGLWFPWEAWYFGRMNIGCDFNRRKIMPFGMTLKWTLRKAASLMGLGRLWKVMRGTKKQESV